MTFEVVVISASESSQMRLVVIKQRLHRAFAPTSQVGRHIFARLRAVFV